MSIRKRMALPLALGPRCAGDDGDGDCRQRHSPASRWVQARCAASMVPAYNACAAPNRTHGPPLAFPSCNPPVQSSTSLTIGSPDANGAGANSVGFIKLAVKVGAPGPPEDSDVNITASATDIRCKAGVAACGSANAADGADYTGELQGTAQIRISDHFNAVAPGGGTDPATVIDIPFPVVTTVRGDWRSRRVGSTCAITTTANAVVPGAVKDGSGRSSRSASCRSSTAAPTVSQRPTPTRCSRSRESSFLSARSVA